MKTVDKLNVTLLLLGYLAFTLIAIYPSLDDFSYSNIVTTIFVEKVGFIDVFNSNIAGFQIFVLVISQISKIPYEVLVAFPFFSITIILLLIVIFKKLIKNSSIWMLLIIIYLSNSTNPIGLLFVHNIGFILLLLIIFFAILRIEVRPQFYNHSQQMEISLIMLILIISLNFISYKLVFFSITFIILLQFIEWFENFQTPSPSNSRKKGFVLIALVGIVIVFSANQYVYNTFLPTIRFYSEFSSSSGIYKLFSPIIDTRTYDPLSEYYLHSPIQITYKHIISLILIFSNLALNAIILFKKAFRKEKYYMGEKIILSLGMTSTILFIIYTSLGLSEMGLFIFTSILAYAIIYSLHSKNYKKFVVVSILLLLSINIYGIAVSISNNYYTSQKDSNNFQYISPVSNWFIKYEINNSHKYIVATDVFTSGYIKKEMAKEYLPIPFNFQILTRDQLMFLFNQDNNSLQIPKDSKHKFIINYKMQHFSILGWETYKSWSNYKQNIKNHPNLNIIFSSGDIDIYTT